MTWRYRRPAPSPALKASAQKLRMEDDHVTPFSLLNNPKKVDTLSKKDLGKRRSQEHFLMSAVDEQVGETN